MKFVLKSANSNPRQYFSFQLTTTNSVQFGHKEGKEEEKKRVDRKGIDRKIIESAQSILVVICCVCELK